MDGLEAQKKRYGNCAQSHTPGKDGEGGENVVSCIAQ
jgi:hypothetical protein